MSVRASSPNRPNAIYAVGWRLAGRSGGAAPFLRVALAIVPTLCQQHSASEEDLQEQGQHVHSHALGGAWLSFGEVATKFFH